jgi:hypothetical protein
VVVSAGDGDRTKSMVFNAEATADTSGPMAAIEA